MEEEKNEQAGLPEEIEERAEHLASGLDMSRIDKLLAYGLEAQAKLLPLSKKLLEQAQRQDAREAGRLITSLRRLFIEMELDLPDGRKKGIRSMFRRRKKQIKSFRHSVLQADKMIGRSAVLLERSKNKMIADTLLLNRFLEENMTLSEELELYILGAKRKLRYMQERGPSENEQAEAIEILERRLYDLRMSREIILQNRIQIRLIQQTNKLLIDKIQTSVITAIPLWRNQAAFVLETMKQQEALAEGIRIFRRTENSLAKTEEQSSKEISRLKEIHSSVLDSLEGALSVEERAEKTQAVAVKELEILTGKRPGSV